MTSYAARMLSDLGVGGISQCIDVPEQGEHEQLRWARSGGMALSGKAGKLPLLAPAPLAGAAAAALVALRALAGNRWTGGELDGAALLGERAAIFDYARSGDVAPGQSCRLIETKDEWLAVNLARESDRNLLPAWLETEAAHPESGAWEVVQRVFAERGSDDLLSRARLMGMPVAPVRRFSPGAPDCPPWFEAHAIPKQTQPAPGARPVVLDLSTLWAGPLCGHLLGLAGARVIKLESLSRPDGARHGPAAFFDLLNAGKESVAVDFTSKAGRHSFEALLEHVDIVIESARPRALRQLGIVAEDWIARHPGRTWLSITGYGRSEPEANWVAFGDDASASAGLCWAAADLNRGDDGPPSPLFCGDAISDPLTGLHSAVAALASWQSGRSQLIDVSLCAVVRFILDQAAELEGQAVDVSVEQDAQERERVRVGDASEVVAPPRARAVVARASSLGADTQSTMASFGVSA
ncbi:MAG TPA: CoA transferase [Myxococcales bacterium]|nr:CoA transferase [Myxococcales bacterium]